jgi:hypothetical protein
MALFEDKNKPVNIYAKGTATAKAQEKMGNAVDIAGRFARKATQNPILQASDAIVPKVANAAQNANIRQNIALAKPSAADSMRESGRAQGIRSNLLSSQNEAMRESGRAQAVTNNMVNSNRTLPGNREATGLVTDSRVVGGNMPGYKPQFGPAAQPGVKEAIVKKPQVPMQTVYQNDGNRVYSTQQPMQQPAQPMAPRRIAGGTTDSGLSIQFTGNVPNAVRQEVMQPSNINDPVAQARRGQAQRQFLGRQGYEEVDPNTGLTGSDMRRMKPIQRAGVMDAVAGRKNERAKLDIDRTLATGNLELGRGRLGVEQEQVGVSKKQAEIQGRTADSAISASQFDIDTKKEARDRQNEMNRARDTYARITDDGEKKRAWQDLIDRGFVQQQPNKFSPITRESVAETSMGAVPVKQAGVMNDMTGEMRWDGDGGQQSAPVLPQDAKQRVKGQVYSNGRGGYAKWDGSGLIPL